VQAREISRSTSTASFSCLSRAGPLVYQVPLFGWHACFRRPELKGQRDQPLLGPVVELALDAAAGLVGRGDDPRAGGR